VFSFFHPSEDRLFEPAGGLGSPVGSSDSGVALWPHSTHRSLNDCAFARLRVGWYIAASSGVKGAEGKIGVKYPGICSPLFLLYRPAFPVYRSFACVSSGEGNGVEGTTS